MELDFPKEGMATLTAKSMQSMFEQVLRTISQMQEKGVPDDTIREKMEKQLTWIDSHSRARLFLKAMGKSLPDDFPSEMLVSSKESKENTLEVSLKQKHPSVSYGSYVRFQNQDWVVSGLKANIYILKKIQSGGTSPYRPGPPLIPGAPR